MQAVGDDDAVEGWWRPASSLAARFPNGAVSLRAGRHVLLFGTERLFGLVAEKQSKTEQRPTLKKEGSTPLLTPIQKKKQLKNTEANI